MPPLAPLPAHADSSAALAHFVGLSALHAVPVWSSAAVLAALVARSVARLLADRAPAEPDVPSCGLTSRTGDAIHLAMAAGMIPMVLPFGLPSPVLVVFFAVTTALVAGAWMRRAGRRRLAARRGDAAPCRPAHALESHHLIIGLAMVVMAWQMGGGPATGDPSGSGAGISAGMQGMPGMAAATAATAAASSGPTLGTLALIYTWAAVVVLGCGLVKAASARPVPSGGVALLAAPVTVYTCELAMTVVMGLMLLG